MLVPISKLHPRLRSTCRQGRREAVGLVAGRAEESSWETVWTDSRHLHTPKGDTKLKKTSETPATQGKTEFSIT